LGSGLLALSDENARDVIAGLGEGRRPDHPLQYSHVARIIEERMFNL